MRACLLFVATLMAISALLAAQTRPSDPTSGGGQAPELIFFSGTIYTGEGFEQDKPQTVEAMAIGGGKILAVGSNEQIKAMAGSSTRLHDLGGSRHAIFVFPGFNDAHTHLGIAGHDKMNLDVTGAASLDAMLGEIASYARTLPSGHWVSGGGWDHTLWAKKMLPTCRDLDKVTAGHPAFLERIDGHIAVVNSAALAAAGITGKTLAPQVGAIDLDKHGNPTGILRESAMGLVERVIPPPSHDERRRGDELAIADAVMHGVTSVQDFSDWEDFKIFEELENQGKLSVRITEWIPFKETLENEEKQRAEHPASDPMLHTGMLKGFMDGSLGSRTAALNAPYADDPGNSGIPQYTQDQLNQMAVERAKAGFQLGFHAIGDHAVSMALDAIEQAELSIYRVKDQQQLADRTLSPCRPEGQLYEVWDEKAPCRKTAEKSEASAGSMSSKFALSAGMGSPRNRIEHAQVVDPKDIQRFHELGVIASMQPCQLLTDMNWAEARLGHQRAAYSYAWKAFLDAGVSLAFGTDYPVEPITPFRGLYAAVTRMNEAGTKSYFPEQKITRGQALYAYTQGSAYAEFAEAHKGKLEAGFDADFILVDRDLFAVPPADLLNAKVLETYVAGRQVYLSGVQAQ